MLFPRCIGGQRQGDVNFAKKKPRAGLACEQQRVLAAPADARFPGQFNLHDRRGINEDPITEIARVLGNPFSQFLQAIAQQLVIVASQRVARDGGLLRIVGKVGAGPSQADASPPVGGSEPGLRAWGAIKLGAGGTAVIIHAAGDDALRTGHQFSRPRAFRAMARHIIHLAVAALRQPIQQSGFCRAEVDAGKADGGKAQLVAPATNPFFQSDPVMHAIDDTCREYALPDEAATLALGAALGATLPENMSPAVVVYLEGDLGAGKTTLVRGLLRKVGAGETAKSPTYTLVEPYVISGLNLYHFDFYRFNVPEEFLDAGLDEYFSDKAANCLCLVEWPDRAQPYLPAADLCVQLALDGTGRRASIEAGSARGQQWLSVFPASPAAISSAVPAQS